MLKIKVCGMKFPGNIREVSALRPDWMGFILDVGSPRSVLGEDASALVSASGGMRRTGVFVNASEGLILEMARRFSLEALQLHGEEEPSFCRQWKDQGFTVLKAFPVGGEKDLQKVLRYRDSISYALLDTRVPGRKGFGGSGMSFDWRWLRSYTADLPFFLSGGIGPESLKELLALRHPHLYGLDLNSRFETNPGVKDSGLLRSFIEAVRSAGVS